MNASDALRTIQSVWLSRLSTQLARGERARQDFRGQLERFFELLVQAVETGDPDWLNPLLSDWVMARTQTELDTPEASLAPFMTQVMEQTFAVTRESLSTEETLTLTSTLIPIFSHLFSHSAQLEVELRVVRLQENLFKMQKKLEKLDRSKSNFIAVAAHELKTPLTLIEGYTAMLREVFPKGDQSSQSVLLLKGIDNGTLRLREIVDDMIDVSLIDNNLLSLNFQPVWLNRLFEPLSHELQFAVSERDQTLTILPFPGSAEMTFGDPERLYQAFRNVLTNAIKYTPNNGSIVVDGRKLPGFVEVTITDTGIGINPENHQRIFEKFGQLGDVSLHSSGKTKFKGGGPGLGLPITKGIIEAHGGTIWVESEGCDEEKCAGSVFHIMVPMRSEPPDDKAAKIFQPLQNAQIQ